MEALLGYSVRGMDRGVCKRGGFGSMALLIDFKGAGRRSVFVLSGDGGGREDAILCFALRVLLYTRSRESLMSCEAPLGLRGG